MTSAVVETLADADDETGYCDKACHMARTDPGWSKERITRRDGSTGLYSLAGVRKVYLTSGVEYTIDNTTIRFYGLPGGLP